MPRDKDFKRLVRRRMRKTGESYSAARARLLGAPRPDADTTPSSPRRSRQAMYPFDQFTSRAQKAMQLAETQARIAGSPLITTEHLLFALFADEGSLAVRVLTELGVGPNALRRTVREPEQAAPDPPPNSPLPTERVKRAIELAFQAAQMMGHVYVGTEHLLLGIFEEGEGVGGRALDLAGATLDHVRPALDRLLSSSPGYRPPAGPRPRGVPNSPEVGALLAQSQLIAQREGSSALRLDHVFRALAEQPLGARLLGDIDLDALATRLTPPRQLAELERRLSKGRGETQEAVNRQDYERAAVLREEEAALQLAWRDAYGAWVASQAS